MANDADDDAQRLSSNDERRFESTDSTPTRFSLRLSPQAKWAVEEIMRLGQIQTIQEAIRRAISDELFLMKERSEGWKVKLEKGNQEREVRWSDHLG